jgi:hypothetical protein
MAIYCIFFCTPTILAIRKTSYRAGARSSAVCTIKYVAWIVFSIGLPMTMWGMQDQVKKLEQKIFVLEKMLKGKNRKIAHKNRALERKNKEISSDKKVINTQKRVIKAQEENIVNYEKSLALVVDQNFILKETVKNIKTRFSQHDTAVAGGSDGEE